jgi:hypothetical protein
MRGCHDEAPASTLLPRLFEKDPVTFLSLVAP